MAVYLRKIPRNESFLAKYTKVFVQFRDAYHIDSLCSSQRFFFFFRRIVFVKYYNESHQYGISFFQSKQPAYS